MRLNLAEFNDQMHNHIDVLISNREALLSLKKIFCSEDRVSPSECKDTIECVDHLDEQNCKFHAFIRLSDQLPLAVVPIRLPLIINLLDEHTQIAKLKRMLAVLLNECWTKLDQPIELLLEIKDELDALLDINSVVLDEAGILLDRADFKEREYSIA